MYVLHNTPTTNKHFSDGFCCSGSHFLVQQDIWAFVKMLLPIYRISTKGQLQQLLNFNKSLSATYNLKLRNSPIAICNILVHSEIIICIFPVTIKTVYCTCLPDVLFCAFDRICTVIWNWNLDMWGLVKLI